MIVSFGETVRAADDVEELQPFSLDPDFDYDAPVEQTARFDVARALVEGEYYDCEVPPPHAAKSPPKHGRRAVDVRPVEPEPKEEKTVEAYETSTTMEDAEWPRVHPDSEIHDVS